MTRPVVGLKLRPIPVPSAAFVQWFALILGFGFMSAAAFWFAIIAGLAAVGLSLVILALMSAFSSGGAQ